MLHGISGSPAELQLVLIVELLTNPIKFFV